ncbi:MAG: sulfatase-like hydrolase/transferase [Planctomycetota bacterium]
MSFRSLFFWFLSLPALFPAVTTAAPPNIIWIVSEDHGPHLGCYGDSFATTPNVDRLASRGLKFSRCWSNAPVCAPTRTTLITGIYATSSGGEHMRSMVPCPSGKAMYPQFLREAGYYCTNNSKEDYNVANPGKVWDESSKKAHWKNRPAGRPFFAVFNSEKSHESKIRTRPHTAIHDPARVRIPVYHPDTPEVRQDWAQYYDAVSEADADAGERLKELEAAGLADETIVFYFSDHGSGMPRSKRWPYNSGLHVPLVIHIPEKYRDLWPLDYVPGGTSDRLVSLIDFAPTLLSLAGVKPPEWMQGHAFLGRYATPPQPYIYGFRGRMDERYDLVRSVTDGRFVYVRQYLPHLIYGQHVDYMFQTPTTRVWKQLHDQGRLTLAQDAFWNKKPPEELYDLQSDPDEVRNLADSQEHQLIKVRLRAAQQKLAADIRDLGFLPEGERFVRSRGDSQFDMARDGDHYPFERIFAAAELASMMAPSATPALKMQLKDPDSSVRYWGVMGISMRGREHIIAAQQELRTCLKDSSPDVAIAAAEALVSFGDDADRDNALKLLIGRANWSDNSVFVCMAALNSLDALGDKAASVAAAIGQLPTKGPVPDARYSDYVPRLIKDLEIKLRK